MSSVCSRFQLLETGFSYCKEKRHPLTADILVLLQRKRQMQSAEGSTAVNDCELDLFTIPSYSSWFSWDEIHDNEKLHHSEFFNNSSLSKNPRVYKQYRDFIVNKYREDPSRRLTFTEVRKSLIGDISSLHKIFQFLDRWGLINFSAPPLPSSNDDPTDESENQEHIVKVDEGPPNGIRVVAYPGSTKIVGAMTSASEGSNDESSAARFMLPPLTSYADAFDEIFCDNCGERWSINYYESSKDYSVICLKCFQNQNFRKDNSAQDYKQKEPNTIHISPRWTDEENALLLEALMKYGDDWSLVAQHVLTKSKLDCILHIIQLPFGEHILGLPGEKADTRSTSNIVNNVKPTEASGTEALKTEEQDKEFTEHAEEETTSSPPPKRRRFTSFADDGGSLIKQVTLLSTAMGPQVAAAAAKAAVTSLCTEIPYAKRIFCLDDNNEPQEFLSVKGPVGGKLEDSETVGRRSPEKTSGPTTIQLRATVATALGVAAAHSKLLADQEDREIEQLMATLIELQMRKLRYKVKYFEELGSIMEMEYGQIKKMKESLISERIDVLRKVFRAGISRWKDHSSVKPFAISSIML
ncbi:SWI/SNF complex subunit SWI3A-like [Aristolochia californica]|uniref:SWI/SNF complex subunit SWI3A-like n=1 Tax=Aristolochia californica TaxID=171875 RepID=UPI0035E2FD66